MIMNNYHVIIKEMFNDICDWYEDPNGYLPAKNVLEIMLSKYNLNTQQKELLKDVINK
jgi:hypothetical protein